MLGLCGPTGATNTLPGLTVTTCVEAPMATSTDATNPIGAKACMVCGAVLLRDKRETFARYARRKFCSHECRVDRVTQFWARVDKRGPDECWPWLGGRCGNGYGRFKVNGKARGAHRIALFGFAGLGDPALACHTCDNPICVNPAHLYAGTYDSNLQDMFDRGRFRSGFTPKLTEEQVREIRTGALSRRAYARKFGISPSSVQSIWRGQTWRHVV